MSDVSFVVLGAGGYMGVNGLISIGKLLPRLKAAGVNADILSVTEPDSRHWENIVRNYPLHQNGLQIFPELMELLLALEARLARNKDPQVQHPIIFYDATPSRFHYGNLALLYEFFRKGFQVAYFGEKPIFLDPKSLEHVEQKFDPQFSIFCDLIETESPVFSAVLDYLVKECPKITKIWHWRAGSSGLKKYICADRAGVQGGALQDKAAHDLSITVGWLGVNRIIGCEVKAASIRELVLAPEVALRNEVRKILTVSNKSADRLVLQLDRRSELPADGVFSMEIDWNLSDGVVVPSEYLFSWLGILDRPEEQQFVDMLKKFGILSRAWLSKGSWELGPNDEDTHPVCKELRLNGPYECAVSEARITLLKLEKGQKQYWVACNFLSTKYGVGLRRFARVYEENSRGTYNLVSSLYEEIESSETYDGAKREDLSSVFERVTNACINKQPAEFIGRKASQLIHSTMLQAQDKAIGQLSEEDFDRLFQQGLIISENRTRLKTLPTSSFPLADSGNSQSPER